MHVKTFLLLMTLAINTTMAVAGEHAVSKFTSTAEKNAIKFHREKDDPSDFRGVYRGFGGYDLEFLGGDERSWINIKIGKAVVDLRDATMNLGAGIGFFPHKANDTVEWRGTEENGKFIPYAVIYRIVGLTENGKRDKTRLVVIKLDKQRSRIIGHADGENAQAEAERIADDAAAK
ncbi:MAG TPA: hypothetical protein VH170_07755 [Chthoniobacterales bacterium]|jgi:hypothetical protein|nr:hypothetical protein [Chthoniobacterales bacterium]